MKLHDAYLSVHEALKHAGVHHGVRVNVQLGRRRAHVVRGGGRVSSSRSTACSCRAASARVGGRARSSPAASRASAGSRTSASASACTSRSREFSRHVVGLEGANSTEMDPETPYPVIDLLPEQKEVEDLGGTMRLGAQAVEVGRGHAGTRRVRRAGRPRAAPAPLRGQQPVPPAARRGRARRLGNVPGGPARRDRRAARAPVVRGEPVPPGVQVTADAPGAALPRLRRRGARPLARAARARRLCRDRC